MRAITPIIATILLLLMAVAAAGAAYLWITLMQSTIAGESQSGLESNTAQMMRQLTIPSAWNETTRVCFIIKNSGTEAYTSGQMRQMTVYISGHAYDWNSTTVPTADFANGQTFVVCMCATGAGAAPCVGPTGQAYPYDGKKIDIKIEPSIGSGSTYNGFQG